MREIHVVRTRHRRGSPTFSVEIVKDGAVAKVVEEGIAERADAVDVAKEVLRTINDPQPVREVVVTFPVPEI